MLMWTQELMAREHFQDILLEAANERLVRQARAERPKLARFVAPALAWLRRRMSAWRLQVQECVSISEAPDFHQIACCQDLVGHDVDRLPV